MSHRSLILVAILLVTAASAEAQDDRRCSGDFRLGFSTAVGELSEVASIGPMLGLGFGCPVGDRLSLRGSADAALRIGSHMHMHHLVAGPHLALTSPDAESWTITARVEGGWTFVQTFGTCPGTCPRWSRVKSSPTAGGGVRLRREMGDIVSLVADAGVRVLFVDSADHTDFEGNVIEGFDTATVLPMSVGLQIQF